MSVLGFASVLLLHLGAGPQLLAVEPVQPDPAHLVVRIRGSGAPNFSVQDQEAPFEVTVAWAGLERGAPDVPRLGPGFLRAVSVTQGSEEGETVSQVRMRLAAITSYRIQTTRDTVEVWFDLPAGQVAFSLAPGVETLAANQPEPAGAPSSPAAPPTEPLRERVAAVPKAPPEIMVEAPVPEPPPAPAPTVRRARAPRSTPRPRQLRPVLGDKLPAAVVLSEAGPQPPAPTEKGPDREPAVDIPELVPAEVALASLPEPREAPVSRTLQDPEASIPRRRIEPPAETPPRDQALARFPGARTARSQPLATFAGRRAEPTAPTPPPARATRSAPPASPEPPPFTKRVKRGRRRVLTYIGFQHMAGTSRAFVRLDGEVQVRTRPSPETDSFVLELLETRIELENNTRPLDTTFFPGPVTLVQAKPVGRDVHVFVRLRSPAAWKLKRVGTTVAVDFTQAR